MPTVGRTVDMAVGFLPLVRASIQVLRQFCTSDLSSRFVCIAGRGVCQVYNRLAHRQKRFRPLTGPYTQIQLTMERQHR